MRSARRRGACQQIQARRDHRPVGEPVGPCRVGVGLQLGEWFVDMDHPDPGGRADLPRRRGCVTRHLIHCRNIPILGDEDVRLVGEHGQEALQVDRGVFGGRGATATRAPVQ